MGLMDRDYMRRDKPSSGTQGDVKRLLKTVKRVRLISPCWLIPTFAIGLLVGAVIGYGIPLFIDL